MAFGALHAFNGAADDFAFRHFQFKFTMDSGCCQKNVDPRPRIIFQCLAGTVDIGMVAACQPANDRTNHLARNRLNGFEISG